VFTTHLPVIAPRDKSPSPGPDGVFNRSSPNAGPGASDALSDPGPAVPPGIYNQRPAGVEGLCGVVHAQIIYFCTVECVNLTPDVYAVVCCTVVQSSCTAHV
jgi:hypothetical protein